MCSIVDALTCGGEAAPECAGELVDFGAGCFQCEVNPRMSSPLYRVDVLGGAVVALGNAQARCGRGNESIPTLLVVGSLQCTWAGWGDCEGGRRCMCSDATAASGLDRFQQHPNRIRCVRGKRIAHNPVDYVGCTLTLAITVKVNV